MDAETDQGKWFQKIHCLFFSSVSWKNCPTTCGCLNKNAQVLVWGAHSQPKPLKSYFFFVAVNLLYVPLVPYRGHRYIFASLTVWLKKKRQNDYVWIPKRVVSKMCSQLSCGILHSDRIWHVTFGVFYLRTKQTCTGRVVGCSCWNNPRPRQFECRGFASMAFFAMSCCGHLLNSRSLENPSPHDFTAYHGVTTFKYIYGFLIYELVF